MKLKMGEVVSRLRLLSLKHSSALEAELLDSGITLKNLALVQREKPLSGDAILQILTDNSSALRPVYSRLLVYYRGGRDLEGFDFFGEMVGSKEGRSFASILSKVDKINPAELYAQLEVFCRMMMEKRVTQAMKKAQKSSLISTLWATVTIFALLINFAVVVIFLDTLELLKSVF